MIELKLQKQGKRGYVPREHSVMAGTTSFRLFGQNSFELSKDLVFVDEQNNELYFFLVVATRFACSCVRIRRFLERS